MDSITQAALGAVCGELVLGRKLGRPAIAWGALFGTLPDLDALLLPFLDTMWDLRLHRGFTHSLLLTLALPWLLARPLARRWKRQKVTPLQAGGFVLLAWSTHVLIDCFTIYGTQVWWPFALRPVSLDNLFIIDPLFTLPLLVAVVWGLCYDKKAWKKGRGLKVAAWCLSVSAVYVGLSFAAKHKVSRVFGADLARRGVAVERRLEAPAPFSILLWRGLVEREDEIWIAYASLFDEGGAVEWTIVPKGGDTLAQWSEIPEVAEIRRFSQDWCLARPTAKGVWLVDLRFGELREWDRRGLALRPLFAWEYQVDGRGDPLKTTGRERGEADEMLRRLGRRALGDREGWSEPPRLIGNPALPQEYLGSVR